MEKSLRIGDLVRCVSDEFRHQIGLEAEVGMYMQDRRKDGLVLFPGQERSAWIPKIDLRITVDGEPPGPLPWLARAHRAMRLVDAIDIDFEDVDGHLMVHIGCTELDGRVWRQLEELLGAGAPALRIRPGSMSRVLVVFPATDASAGVAIDSGGRAS